MTDYIEQWFYDITLVSRLPYPTDLERPPCMTDGISAWQRRWRAWRPDPRPRDCCWFHSGNWHEASEHAMAMIDGISLERVDDGISPFSPVRDRLRAAGLTGWMHEAVRSLTCGGEPINYGDTSVWQDPDAEPGYVGGRHRALAMMQQGVRTTVTMRFELLDPETRQIIIFN